MEKIFAARIQIWILSITIVFLPHLTSKVFPLFESNIRGSVSWVTFPIQTGGQTKLVEYDLARRVRSEWTVPLADRNESLGSLTTAGSQHYIGVTFHETKKLISVYDFQRNRTEGRLRTSRISVPSVAIHASLAPNGNMLAAVIGEPKSGFKVVVYRLDAKTLPKELKLIRRADGPVDWDKQSENLLYEENGNVLIYNFNSDRATVLGEGLRARWLPNGNVLAYGSSGFILYDIARKTRTVMRIDAAGLRDFIPSSDGEYIALSTKTNALVTRLSDVKLVHLSTRKTFVIVENEAVTRFVALGAQSSENLGSQ